MEKLNKIITDHLGEEWYKRSNIPTSELAVLMDRLQEAGMSLRRSVWQILSIALLKDQYGSMWLQQPSQARLHILDSIGLWGDLKYAADYFVEYRFKNYKAGLPDGVIPFYNLLIALEETITSSGFDSSNVP